VAKLFARGFALHKRGLLNEALQVYVRVLKAEPRNPIALHYAALLGRTVNQHAKQNGRPSADGQVMRLMALSIAAAPHNAGAVHNFAKFKHDAGELADAIQLYRNALAIDPQQGESWMHLGGALGALGDRASADEAWSRAMECPTTTPDARFNVSFLRLLRGEYARGFADYESRWDCPEFLHSYGRPDLPWPRWTISAGGRLLLHAEQGAGDALMMLRYLPLVRPLVDALAIEVPKGLMSLVAAVCAAHRELADVTVLERGVTIERSAFDHQLPMLSLPAVFGTTLETIPPPVEWRPVQADGEPISVESGRIGLCWRGSTTHSNDRTRSMPFEACFPLLDLADSHGLTFQSLQFGYTVSEPLDACPTGDFLETARQIARCETVVSCDTSVAHLAGSMGVKTLVMLPFIAEWRWLLDRSGSPWYPSATLVRQRAAGDWGSAIEQVTRAILDTRR